MFQTLRYERNASQQSVHRQKGFVAIYKHFSGFKFPLLPSRVHARPHATYANRWAVHFMIT